MPYYINIHDLSTGEKEQLTRPTTLLRTVTLFWYNCVRFQNNRDIYFTIKKVKKAH